MRTTCYTSRVLAAAKLMGLPDESSADDVLQAVIAGQSKIGLDQARQIMLKALAQYEDNG